MNGYLQNGEFTSFHCKFKRAHYDQASDVGVQCSETGLFHVVGEGIWAASTGKLEGIDPQTDMDSTNP